MDELQRQMWDVLCSMSSEGVANAFTNFYGNQLLSEEFAQFLIDEGYAGVWDLSALEEEEEENN